MTGTLNLLEVAVAAGASRFVFTSTTSAFGEALTPPPGARAAWITEQVAPVAKNVYGATKTAAEDLCSLVRRDHGLPVVVLRTSRFFPEGDYRDDVRALSATRTSRSTNSSTGARTCRMSSTRTVPRSRAPAIRFDRFIVSATTPFTREDLRNLRKDAPAVVRRRVPEYEVVYAERGWRMLPSIDRVYVNAAACEALGWTPRWEFREALTRLAAGEDHRSPLARAVGAKGYHAQPTGIYTQ